MQSNKNLEDLVDSEFPKVKRAFVYAKTFLPKLRELAFPLMFSSSLILPALLLRSSLRDVHQLYTSSIYFKDFYGSILSAYSKLKLLLNFSCVGITLEYLLNEVSAKHYFFFNTPLSRRKVKVALYSLTASALFAYGVGVLPYDLLLKAGLVDKINSTFDLYKNFLKSTSLESHILTLEKSQALSYLPNIYKTFVSFSVIPLVASLPLFAHIFYNALTDENLDFLQDWKTHKRNRTIENLFFLVSYKLERKKFNIENLSMFLFRIRALSRIAITFFDKLFYKKYYLKDPKSLSDSMFWHRAFAGENFSNEFLDELYKRLKKLSADEIDKNYQNEVSFLLKLFVQSDFSKKGVKEDLEHLIKDSENKSFSFSLKEKDCVSVKSIFSGVWPFQSIVFKLAPLECQDSVRKLKEECASLLYLQQKYEPIKEIVFPATKQILNTVPLIYGGELKLDRPYYAIVTLLMRGKTLAEILLDSKNTNLFYSTFNKLFEDTVHLNYFLSRRPVQVYDFSSAFMRKLSKLESIADKINSPELAIDESVKNRILNFLCKYQNKKCIVADQDLNLSNILMAETMFGSVQVVLDPIVKLSTPMNSFYAFLNDRRNNLSKLETSELLNRFVSLTEKYFFKLDLNDESLFLAIKNLMTEIMFMGFSLKDKSYLRDVDFFSKLVQLEPAKNQQFIKDILYERSRIADTFYDKMQNF